MNFARYVIIPFIIGTEVYQYLYDADESSMMGALSTRWEVS